MYTNGISSMFSFGLSQLQRNQEDVNTSLERLTTGKRVNRTSDDPAAMVSIAAHEVEIYSMNKKFDALSQEEAFLGAKEGGLSVINDLYIELESLVIQAANTGGLAQGELEALQEQARSISAGMSTIVNTTTFKGSLLLSEYSSTDVANIADLMQKDPEEALERAKNATKNIARKRGALGNRLNEIESQKTVIGETLLNHEASLSSIQDTDYAKETAKLVRAQILESATIKAIEISRENAQQVLGLIQHTVQTG